MVLVHGLLVILDSRRFSSVEVRRCVGIYTMGELKLIGLVEIHRQVVRRQLARAPLQIKKSVPSDEQQFFRVLRSSQHNNTQLFAKS